MQCLMVEEGKDRVSVELEQVSDLEHEVDGFGSFQLITYTPKHHYKLIKQASVLN